MRGAWVYKLAFLVSLALLGGCHSTSRRGDLQDVETMLRDRIGGRLAWRNMPEDAEVDGCIASLLKKPLTPDTAVRIALLNNRSLQASLEELSISRADLVQAGLLQNPVFYARPRVPDRSPSKMNNEFSLTQNFIEVFLIPARKKVAGARLEQAKLRIGQQVLDLAAQVKTAYYELQAEQQMLALRRRAVQAVQLESEVAGRQQEAGNIADLELVRRQALADQIQVDLMRAEFQRVSLHERLNQLLGLGGEESVGNIPDELPRLPGPERDLGSLEALALERRLDLAAARQEEQIIADALALTRRGIISTLEIGVDTERDSSGANFTGPSLQVELPLFDRRQAAIARLEAQGRQAQNRRMAQEVKIKSEVRLAHGQLIVSRRLAERYQTAILPRQTAIVTLSQQRYNAMVLGVYALLEAKGQEMEARRQYAESLRDYWIARTHLEQAVGEQLPVSPPVALPAPASAPAPTPPLTSRPRHPTSRPAMPMMPMHHHGG